jgi:uncharacterized protein (DUF4415 family)
VIEGMKAFDREPTAAELKETPAWSDEEWKKAKRVQGIRTNKTPINLRLDPEVVTWLKSFGKGYTSRANQILRIAMLSTQADKPVRRPKTAGPKMAGPLSESPSTRKAG